jgi:hypothetical protein
MVKLIGRTTQPEDINQCLDSVRDRFVYSDHQLQNLRAMWLALLSSDIARSAVVIDESEPRRILAFGISAPVKQSRFDEIFRDHSPFITRTLLEEWLSAQNPFLDEREYASANGSGGLNVFTLNNGISEVVPENAFAIVLSKLTETFVTQYAGCNLKSTAHESFGVPREFAIDLGLSWIEHSELHKHLLVDCPPDRRPSIVFVSREQAVKHPGNLTLNTLFLRFTPPIFSFDPIERRLLRFAIEGESDLRISDLLHMAPRTLKARWAKIYLTMERATGVSSGGSLGRRGVEARRHVLRYIRQHPEELHAHANLRAPNRDAGSKGDRPSNRAARLDLSRNGSPI